MTRSAEEIRTEIATERAKLVHAVAHLRTDVRSAANAKSILRSQAPRIVAGFAITAGTAMGRTLIRRRLGKSSSGKALTERLALGRYVVYEKD